MIHRGKNKPHDIKTLIAFSLYSQLNPDLKANPGEGNLTILVERCTLNMTVYTFSAQYTEVKEGIQISNIFSA